MKEAAIKVLHIFTNVLFWLILSIEVILLILFYSPRLFNGDCYVVSSGSMEPDYPVGSLVYIEKVAPELIQVGDIITFHLTDDIIATHQVNEVDAENHQFRTHGINNRDGNGNILPDSRPVTYDQYIGRAVYDVPFLGYIYLSVKNRFLAYLALALFIVLMLKWISVKLKNDRTEVKHDGKS